MEYIWNAIAFPVGFPRASHWDTTWIMGGILDGIVMGKRLSGAEQINLLGGAIKATENPQLYSGKATANQEKFMVYL